MYVPVLEAHMDGHFNLIFFVCAKNHIVEKLRDVPVVDIYNVLGQACVSWEHFGLLPYNICKTNSSPCNILGGEVLADLSRRGNGRFLASLGVPVTIIRAWQFLSRWLDCETEHLGSKNLHKQLRGPCRNFHFSLLLRLVRSHRAAPSYHVVPQSKYTCMEGNK